MEPSNGRRQLTLSYLSSSGFRLSFTPKILAVDLNSVKVRTLIPFAVGSRLQVKSGTKVLTAKVLDCRCENDVALPTNPIRGTQLVWKIRISEMGRGTCNLEQVFGTRSQRCQADGIS